MSFLFVGCDNPLLNKILGLDDEESADDSEMTDEEFDEYLDGAVLNLYGTKVMYRADDYFEETTGGTNAAGQNIDYYGKYAWYILNDLYNLYGVVLQTGNDTDPYKTRLDNFNTANIPYLYDSIRYQADTAGMVTKSQVQDKEGNWGAVGDASEQYFIVGADPEGAWRWRFDYNREKDKSLLTSIDEAVYTQNNKVYSINYSNESEFASAAAAYYQKDSTIDVEYTKDYLGTDKVEETAKYSELVKALEYAIYSYALDITPVVNVSKNDAGATAPYTVSIGGKSVDDALVEIKAVFGKIASYVGLSQRQAKKLKTWIVENVIGPQAEDDFKYYNEVIEKIDNTGKISYEFVETSIDKNRSGDLGRNYQVAVDNIVTGVCDQVEIGTPDGEGGKIDDKFLSSKIAEYSVDSFVVPDDALFCDEVIPAKEYQSAVLMMREETTIDGIYIALKYDADMDGTEEGVWDLNKYIDIIVELNYYNREKNKLFTIGSIKTRVYDGPFDPYHEDPPDMYEDFGNVYFYDWAGCGDPEIQDCLNEEGCLVVGAFNTEIGNGVLKTDVGEAGYKLGTMVSKNPIVLVGTHPARRYYELLEPSDDENLEGKTYVTGRLNPDKFSGADGCDYLEVTYKVLKDSKSDTNKNYKFYTGIGNVY